MKGFRKAYNLVLIFTLIGAVCQEAYGLRVSIGDYRRPTQSLEQEEFVYGDIDIKTPETKERIEEILKIDRTKERGKAQFIHRVKAVQSGLMKLIYLTDKSGKIPIGYILYEPKNGNLAHFRRVFVRTEFRQKGIFRSLLKFCIDNFDGIILSLHTDEFNSSFNGEEKLKNLQTMCFGLGFKPTTTGEFYWMKAGSINEEKISREIRSLNNTMREKEELAQEIPFTPVAEIINSITSNTKL